MTEKKPDYNSGSTQNGIYRNYGKRLLDFSFALILIVLSSPFIALGYLLVKLDSKGTAFFTQTRIGKDSQEFKIFKLRTMKLETHDADGRRLKDRERITRSGKIIRKLSIDELPQLLNILKGEMSFIGPRPLIVRYLPFYTEEEIRRHDVLPGITGLAQVNGRSNLQWEKRFAFDLEYVRNASFKLDWEILMKTIAKVFNGSDTSTVRIQGLVDLDQHRGYKKLR